VHTLWCTQAETPSCQLWCTRFGAHAVVHTEAETPRCQLWCVTGLWSVIPMPLILQRLACAGRNSMACLCEAQHELDILEWQSRARHACGHRLVQYGTQQGRDADSSLCALCLHRDMLHRCSPLRAGAHPLWGCLGAGECCVCVVCVHVCVHACKSVRSHACAVTLGVDTLSCSASLLCVHRLRFAWSLHKCAQVCTSVCGMQACGSAVAMSVEVHMFNWSTLNERAHCCAPCPCLVSHSPHSLACQPCPCIAAPSH